VRKRIGGAVLVAHGLLTAATWGAMFSGRAEAPYAIGAVFGIGHVVAGVPVALGKERFSAASVLLVAGIWIAALVLAIAWRQSEVSGFHVFWGVAILALISGAPTKVRLPASIVALSLIDAVFLFGAILRIRAH
jgi:hypothetical protein